MKRQPLLSRAPQSEPSVASGLPQEISAISQTKRDTTRIRWALFALCAVLCFWWWRALQPAAQKPITQKQIDAAVAHTLENMPLPSQAARAYEAISPSVVRVRGFDDPSKASIRDKMRAPKSDEKDSRRIDPFEEDPSVGVGSGVIIKDDGTILTNLHVVQGMDVIKVTFFNGMETEAVFVGAQAQHDLAVIKPKKIPDDLQAATMKSTHDLRSGDLVVAVGYPFGIGPSASAGVVSGLKREFRSPQGKRMLTNLIQFDAAANPGNSGGPLVTAQGEVVGIVTGILNPTDQRVFIGIGFAVPIENATSSMGMSPF